MKRSYKKAVISVIVVFDSSAFQVYLGKKRTEERIVYVQIAADA